MPDDAARENDEATSDLGWLCVCGAWIEHGGCCHRTPPWGCIDDCGIEDEIDEESYDFRGDEDA